MAGSEAPRFPRRRDDGGQRGVRGARGLQTDKEHERIVLNSPVEMGKGKKVQHKVEGCIRFQLFPFWPGRNL